MTGSGRRRGAGGRGTFETPFSRIVFPQISLSGLAVAIRLQSLEQRLHGRYPFGKRIQFDQLAVRQLPYRVLARVPSAKPKQRLDFVEGEPRPARPLDHGEAIQHRPVVAALPAASICPRENSQTL